MRYKITKELFAVVVFTLGSLLPVHAQTNFTTLYSFTNGSDGAYPIDGFILSGNKLYGTADHTVFKINTNGTGFTTLHSFIDNGENEDDPRVILSGSTLYGTTYNDGDWGDGTVFAISINGTGFTILYNFTGGNDGVGPGGLILSGNTLYGTAFGGAGTVFAINTNGTGFTNLYNFTGGSDGDAPTAGLILSGSTLYGTTGGGGSFGRGTVFAVNTDGTGFTNLHSFTATGVGTNSDGATPNGGLILSGNTLYGTAQWGGGSGSGTVFAINTNGTGFTTLYSFTAETGVGTNSDGYRPQAGLILSSNTLYGTTYGGGSSSWGTVFAVNTDGTGFANLHSFTAETGAGTNSDGIRPYDSLILSGNTLYGTAYEGGTSGLGTVFALSLLPPVITTQPVSQTNYAGSAVMFTVIAATQLSASYQWQKNCTNLVDGGNISGSATNTLTITGILDSDAASYSVIVSNSYGIVTSSNATLTVIDPPVITAQPKNVLVLPGTNVTFGVSLTGSASFFQYQWQFNGTNILNATNATYAISSVATTNAGYYSLVVTNLAGIVTSSNAALTVVLSPNSQTNYANSTATFAGTAFSPESLNYQWQKNGTNLVNGGNISGATNNTLTIASVSDADAAIYNLVVSDATGSVTTSNATLTVNDLPIIATQPLSQSIGVGSNVTFSATAYGASPLVFQWYFGSSPVGSPTTGTNVSSYTLTDVQTNQSGNYSVQVFNGYDSATSSNAVLTVMVFAPSITTQPTNQSVLQGNTASFCVSANGSAPLQYQWQFNSTNILGATNAAYAIPAVVASNTGNYSVTVTNSAGGVISSNAMLTVIVPPVVSFQFLSGYPLLNLNGMLSSNFVVQYSTNLACTNWINLRSISNLSGNPYQFLDPAGSGQPARFYRAIMQ
jgi:uncharacterized repeat protein (TIGR03803 family)